MANRTQEVSAVVEAFAACWNVHDMTAFGDLFAPDAEFVNVVGLWWKGREAIREAHAFIHATMFKHSRLTFQSIDIRFPADTLAITRAHWTLEGHVSPQGDALPARTGLMLNVLAQTPSGWQIIDSQNTDIVDGELSRPQ
ncbi:SgcJ/EcaC family oxidoreductase [Sinimarinibacterium sp. CAU 1509]|uniref:SgcJ/EcaC family oxidoreductase n=1 Tax=Sinimarinibacterium sp. CAU 1509 TaxID=2562283 RepID=UPI0010AC6636|nr:SgcJ/EcaC family oxidoreductase [Sinimarinibacterium sp. CAU 1509]TJY58835.1 SgcJ/EcaC family oxidoreductase [Sinimarinibacterium sp. CAU 1509]